MSNKYVVVTDGRVTALVDATEHGSYTSLTGETFLKPSSDNINLGDYYHTIMDIFTAIQVYRFYAVVAAGIVTEFNPFDPETDYSSLPSDTHGTDDGSVQVGYLYNADTGVFSAPE
jgi:hypothetical protein